MTFGAQKRDIIAELGCGRVLNIVHAMTIDAGRYVRVALLGQGGTMNAFLVDVVDRARVQRAVGFIGWTYQRRPCVA